MKRSTGSQKQLKLLKFDIIHPAAYLEEKKRQWPDLANLSLAAYRDRLIALRSNYSDFYTYWLKQKGWQAEEFFLMDDDYLAKTAAHLYGSSTGLKKLQSRLKDKLRPKQRRWEEQVIRDYIEAFDPDVLFVRSQPLPSQFWQKYRGKRLLVARLSARLPFHWHPNHWDLIYTDHPDFARFFELHDVPTKLNDQGFDPRILSELQDEGKTYDLTFVGGLGTQNFRQRTEFFEQVAAKADFRWWGYWWEHGGKGRLTDFPNLKRTFQGPTSGLDMFQVYRNSRIVLNDYVDTANGLGVNQRIYEILGTGSLMLTREAPNFGEMFPGHLFATYKDLADCLSKVDYYLAHDKEREELAAAGQGFIVGNYSYERIVGELDEVLRGMVTP